MSNDQANADDGEPTGNVGTRVLQAIVPDMIRRRFALKFALVLVIMGLLLAGLGFTATNALSDQVQEDTEAEYQRLATQQGSIVEKWIQRNAVSARLASQNQGLSMDRGQASDLALEVNAIWRSILGGANQIHLVSTSEQEPEVIAQTGTTGMDPVAVSQTRLTWIDSVDLGNMSAGRVNMSGVYSADGTPVIGFVTPVDGPKSRYLIVEYEVSELSTTLASESETGHFTQVVSGDRTVQADTRLATGDGQSNIGESYANAETIQQATERPGDEETKTAGVRIIENDPSVMGESYAVGYASIEVEDIGLNDRLAVVTHAPTSDLFGFVQTVSRWGQIVTLVGALLIALIGATMGYSTASAIDRLRGKVEEMEEGNLEVEIHSTRIDSIGRLYDGFASMRDALSQQINEAEQARKEAEVARAEAMEMNDYLQAKAEEYSEIMGQCASGDLTQRMDVDGENEAMDQIATDFNEMIGELEKTTGQLKHFADEVEEAGDVVETSAESVRDASEQVAESVQHISDDAHDQQERLEELSTAIDGTIEQFERLASEAGVDVTEPVDQLRDVATAINDLAELTDAMMAESENVAGAAEEQAAELNSVSQQARDLTRYARPLKDVLESFETEEEHEFYFPTGPGSPQTSDGS